MGGDDAEVLGIDSRLTNPGSSCAITKGTASAETAQKYLGNCTIKKRENYPMKKSIQMNMLKLKKNKSIFRTTVAVALIIFSMVGCEHHKEIGIVERMDKLNKDNQLIVQLAELEIDSAQLGTYLEFLKEGIQTSVKTEPGVLTMYAMEEEENPTKITIVEIYAGKEAYESHIASPHFQKYKKGTLSMVDSLKLTRMKPTIFAAKPK